MPKTTRLILVIGLALLAITLPNSAHAASVTKSVKGSHGETLSVTPYALKPGGALKVQGKRFDETVGIYLAFCVLPSKGEIPTPCGGGINKAGIGDASYWISSNPPPYGIGLAQEYLPGGRFTRTMHIFPMIGKFDCRKVRCAITVRADHLREGDRSYDLFIPIKFISTTKAK